MSQVTIKIPRNTYLAVKAMAKKRGCFIGKIIADAVTLYSSAKQESNTPVPPWRQLGPEHDVINIPEQSTRAFVK